MRNFCNSLTVHGVIFVVKQCDIGLFMALIFNSCLAISMRVALENIATFLGLWFLYNTQPIS